MAGNEGLSGERATPNRGGTVRQDRSSLRLSHIAGPKPSMWLSAAGMKACRAQALGGLRPIACSPGSARRAGLAPEASHPPPGLLICCYALASKDSENFLGG